MINIEKIEKLEAPGLRDQIMDGRHYEIAAYYSREDGLEKLREELGELKLECRIAEQDPDGPREEVWAAAADVINACIHAAIQHGKLEAVMGQMDDKLERETQQIRARAYKDGLLKKFLRRPKAWVL